MKKTLFVFISVFNCFIFLSTAQADENTTLASCQLKIAKVAKAQESLIRPVLIADISADLTVKKPFGELTVETEIGKIQAFFSIHDGRTNDLRLLMQNIVIWSVESKDGTDLAFGTYDPGAGFMLVANAACSNKAK